MDRIANSAELQQELKNLLAYAEEPNPSRERIASKLNELAGRLEASTEKTAGGVFSRLASTARDLIDACQEIEDAAISVSRGDSGAVGNMARIDNMARKSRVYEAKCRLMIKALQAAEGATSD